MDTAKAIIESLPERFKPETVPEDFSTVFHFSLSGDNGGDFTVTIEDGMCNVEEGLHGEPKCTVEAKAKTYKEIELGKQNAQMAFLMGKIKISNINAMLKFVDSFERLH